MLRPKYLEQLPDNMVELYSQAEMDILADMARRISTYDYFIPAAQWQYKKVIEMGNYHGSVVKTLSALTGKTTEEIEFLMAEAGQKALAFDDSIYSKAGPDPPPLAASPALQDILRIGVAKTNGLFDNLTKTTANTATKQFERALDQAYMQVTSGAFDYNTSIRNAIKGLAAQGIASVEYPTGKVEYLETAVRRAVTTGVNQTALRLQDARADQMGSDLVETTAHAGARPSHVLWQGQIFSRSGNHPKYPNFVKATGYGTGAGLGGWNCRHSYFPFFEGLSESAYSREDLAEMNAKNITFNGEKMTEFEASQKQRYIERQIRRWKREYVMMDAAKFPTEEAAARLAAWRRTLNDFTAQTGLKRQSGREQIAGFGKTAASKAGGTAKQQAAIKAGKYTSSSLAQKTTIEAENWARQTLGVPDVDYHGQDVDIANTVNRSLQKIFKEYPILHGFIDEIKFDSIQAVAQASLRVRNGVIHAGLTFSPSAVKDINSINKLIEQQVKLKFWSPKKGLYGLTKHEAAHLAEYAATLKKYGVTKTGANMADLQSALSAVKAGEISEIVKTEALKNCNLPYNDAIIKKHLSEYATVNSKEFLAEAVSEFHPRRLAKEAVRIFKEILRGL
ncbi:phage minor capsid protein [Dehalobacter sp.]|uniref:phage minor capsid protein n=1 Tax=Dehalobacter sp. TaxID=1962289 RepID=UPI00258C252C|nr:phage minor capsid protein [Dehalobacter sp.]MDJ0305383.1 phage minor capsid protein [Dehalobacter sp.]